MHFLSPDTAVIGKRRELDAEPQLFAHPQVAAAMIGSAVVGGVVSSQAAGSAANAQKDAANSATQAQRDMFNQAVGLESPFRQAGIGATNKLSYLLGISPSGYSPQGVDFAGNNIATPANAAATNTAPVQAKQPIPWSYGGAEGMQDDPNNPGFIFPGSVQPQSGGLQAQAQAIVPTNGAATVAPGATNAPANASTDPAYGSLLHNFDLSDFQMDPGIQFQTQQGNLALQNSQAAGDGVLSGAALKGLIGFNQGMAGTGYQSAYDRYMANKSFTLGSLMDMSKQGQAAAGNTVNSAGSFSSGIANTITGAGNAQASGIVGSANAISSGLTGASNAYLLRNMMSSGGSSGGGGSSIDPSMLAG